MGFDRTLFAAALGAALLGTTLPASAWLARSDEDPMSDNKIAYIAQISSGFVLFAKCWENDPDETLFGINTLQPYDQSASYKDEIDVLVRIDKGEKYSLKMRPQETSGRLVFLTTQAEDEQVIPILAEVSRAKKHVAVSMETIVLTFPARGSTKAVDKLFKTCGITAPTDG
jgi:hypothetical protein